MGASIALYDLGITEAGAAIRKGDITVEKLAETLLARIAANKHHHAIWSSLKFADRPSPQPTRNGKSGPWRRSSALVRPVDERVAAHFGIPGQTDSFIGMGPAPFELMPKADATLATTSEDDAELIVTNNRWDLLPVFYSRLRHTINAPSASEVRGTSCGLLGNWGAAPRLLRCRNRSSF